MNEDGECSAEDDDDIELVLDLDGEPIEAELDDSELNAINNIGRRKQESYGGSVQLGLQSQLFGGENDLTLGVAYSSGKTTSTPQWRWPACWRIAPRRAPASSRRSSRLPSEAR